MEITRLDRLARLGYSARAAVYALFGYLALTTSSLAVKGPKGSLELLQGVPAGKIILLVLALGLLSYGLYKTGSALFDGDGDGMSAKGIAKRIGRAGGGLIYLATCWAAIRLAVGMSALNTQGSTEEAAATALQLPLGTLVLASVGIGFLVFAAFQTRKVITKRFMRKLQPDAPALTCTAGRIGLTARAVVLAIVGGSLVRAAWHHSNTQVRDLGSALASLRQDYILYLLVTVGLIVFACYSALEARYRIVPRIDPVKAGKRMAER